jgi:hypothetical protein
MAWVRYEDDFYDHPKVSGLTDKAYRLWTGSIAHSNRFRLDGLLTTKEQSKLRGRWNARSRHVDEIIECRLWHRNLDSDLVALRQHFGNEMVALRQHFGSEMVAEWLDSGNGDVLIHDIFDYQPRSKKRSQISEVRAEAGRKGAAKRWQIAIDDDGKLPSRQNAPDPTRPDPTPCGVGENDKIEFGDLEPLLFKKFGSLGGAGKHIAAVRNLSPYRRWEIEEALRGWPKRWGGFVDFVMELREEDEKDRPQAKDRGQPEYIPEYLRKAYEE